MRRKELEFEIHKLQHQLERLHMWVWHSNNPNKYVPYNTYNIIHHGEIGNDREGTARVLSATAKDIVAERQYPHTPYRLKMAPDTPCNLERVSPDRYRWEYRVLMELDGGLTFETTVNDKDLDVYIQRYKEKHDPKKRK